EALDALAELLRPLDIDLLHPVLAGGQVGRWRERRYLARLLVVEGHVRDQVTDDRERPQRRDGDGLRIRERRHPRHARQPGQAVDLHRTGAALAGLAVPAAGQVGSLGGLDPVDDVEDDLALVHLDLVVLQVAAGAVAPPDPEVTLRTHQSSPFMLATAASYSASSSSVMYLASSA